MQIPWIPIAEHHFYGSFKNTVMILHLSVRKPVRIFTIIFIFPRCLDRFFVVFSVLPG
jgi:hypothetical protein